MALNAIIALFRTSSIMLNRSGKSGHPCIFPILRKSFQSLLIEYDVKCGFFTYGFFYDEASLILIVCYGMSKCGSLGFILFGVL